MLATTQVTPVAQSVVHSLQCPHCSGTGRDPRYGSSLISGVYGSGLPGTSPSPDMGGCPVCQSVGELGLIDPNIITKVGYQKVINGQTPTENFYLVYNLGSDGLVHRWEFTPENRQAIRTFWALAQRAGVHQELVDEKRDRRGRIQFRQTKEVVVVRR